MSDTKQLQVKTGRPTPDPERTRERPAFLPPTDVFETPDSIVVICDMPGVDRDSVEITLERNALDIWGSVEEEAPKGQTLQYAEYSVGDYHRAFVLSETVDRDRIEAVVKNGVVRLTLPKTAPAKAKKIAVRAG